MTLPVKAGGVVEIETGSLGHSGEGVGRYENFTVFVPGALPEEKVVVKIKVVKKNYAVGEIVSWEKVSPQRVEPRCPVAEICGGCQLQHLSYEGQLKFKENVVRDAVKRIGKLEGVLIKPCLGAEEPWYWRNKMQMPVGDFKSQTVAGCFAQGTHRIVPTAECLIQHQANNIVLAKTVAALNKLKISAYNEKTGTGVVRHIMGRVGVKTGEVMVVLVSAGRELPEKKRLISLLKDTIPNLTGIMQNINPARTNVILGKETVVLWGKDKINDRLGEFSFAISAASFFQVNTPQAEVLYEKAFQYAALTKNDVVLDAYCGTGTITLFLAKNASFAYGIEINAAAVKDAQDNAAHNKIFNAEFFTGDAVAIMPQLLAKGLRPDVIVTDPPRAGCGEKVLAAFLEMDPKRIVYISCNPASLARDLAYLAQSGYVAREIQPVDLFPQTYHVEAVALIERA
jgi:23S rRNA (uracil1939-C5)-methyltransferase